MTQRRKRCGSHHATLTALTPDGGADYLSPCLRRGRRANHQTEMIEAKTPRTPIVDFAPLLFWFSAMTHRNEQNAGDMVPGVVIALIL